MVRKAAERLRQLVLLNGLSRRWQYVVYLLAGVILGAGVVTLRIANATSYLSDSPETCVNCHVMRDAYASWLRGSHGRTAVCNDCHVPHDNMAAMYAFKATDGLKHSYVFTLRGEPQVLGLSTGARPVVQANCLRCHAEQLTMIRLAGVSERRCWDCHENIHGGVRSLSSSYDLPGAVLQPAGLGFGGKGGK